MIDLARFGHPFPGDRVGERKVELASVRHRRRDRFIPPMPFEWFRRACLLPGKAAILAAALWYLSRRRGSATVRLSQASLNEFGISRQARYRALRSLEEAGLVTVRRRDRKNPEVTVLLPAARHEAGTPDGSAT
jgi:hypothetical protein